MMSGSTSTSTVYYLIAANTAEVMQYGTSPQNLWASFQQSSGAQSITQTQYNTLAAGGRYLWLNNALVVIPATANPLAAAQTAATASVNLAAEQARLQFITPGFGMMLSYMEKVQEAKSFLAAYPTDAAFTAASPQPTAAEYPMIFAEVGITASDAFGVATVYQTKYAAWLVIGAQIEHLRLGALAAIAAATTFAEVQAALAITWPVPA